jgi:RNA polymerase sigma-70 factor, ECF subfamily
MKKDSPAVLQQPDPFSAQILAENTSFEEIVSLYRLSVFRFALSLLRDHDAAETVAQDCFMRAFHSLDGFRHECSFQAWLMKITVNLVRDHVRNRRLQFWKRLSAAPERPLHTYADRKPLCAETGVINRQQIESVWKVAENLPERQREVSFLRFVEDMDILEIVTVTGMKEGTVKSHLFRALQSVRSSLKGIL